MATESSLVSEKLAGRRSDDVLCTPQHIDSGVLAHGPSLILWRLPGSDLCRKLNTDFGEHPFRDCPKRVCRVVIRYCSTHEKEISNRPLRCRVVLHRASPAYSESCRKAQKTLLTRDP